MKTRSLAPDLEVRPSAAAGLVDSVATIQVMARNGVPGRQMRPALESLMTLALDSEQRLSEQAARIRQLESLSLLDELTGFANRKGVEAELSRTLARAERSGEQGLLVLCDLDRFAAVNRTYGRAGGDAVLRTMAAILGRSVRGNDIVGRVGADAFAIVMTNAAAQEAARRMERLRRSLSGLMVQWEGLRIPISASVGYAAYGPNSEAKTLMAMAEKALDKMREAA